jgi:hypothetical protein
MNVEQGISQVPYSMSINPREEVNTMDTTTTNPTPTKETDMSANDTTTNELPTIEELEELEPNAETTDDVDGDDEDEDDETPKIVRPSELAEVLDIDPKALRGFLRKEFPRSSKEHNTSWSLTPEMIEAATDHFSPDDEDEDDEVEADDTAEDTTDEVATEDTDTETPVEA